MRKFLWPILLALAGCATAPRGEAPPAEAPPPAPPVPEAAPPAPGASWHVVASNLSIRVFRDGPMQKLGHDHLIVSKSLTGDIAVREPLAASSFVLRVPLESLVVDDAEARAAAGGIFAAPVPARDAEGTRRNMLGEKLLNAAREPVMTLASESVTESAGGYEARVRVGLAGGEHVVTVPFTLRPGKDVLAAHAEFRLTHADLGLEPFTVALGALKVRDDFEVDLTLEARPAA
jgi:hypothetical protein